jgi:hypothetical protein
VQSDRQRRMERMVEERVGSGKKPKGLEIPETVVVESTMIVEWPLTGKTADEIVLESHKLERTIRDAELAGKKDQTLSPEEEEVAAELTVASPSSSDESSQPGEPQFVFVARITAEERQKLMADAITMARERAEELAKAAGVEAGPLAGISGQGTAGDSIQNASSDDNSGWIQRSSPVMKVEEPERKPYESVASDPKELSFTFEVSAMFKLGK